MSLTESGVQRRRILKPHFTVENRQAIYFHRPTINERSFIWLLIVDYREERLKGSGHDAREELTRFHEVVMRVMIERLTGYQEKKTVEKPRHKEII